MYELVDAVNQQFPLPNGAGHLLVLTKFAELVANPRNPVRRVGLERFVAMTRMDEKTVRRQLKWLHEQGYLVCLDADVKKKRGDRPKLYELRLPEGYDPVVIGRRRARYYGGKPFCPKFFEGDGDRELKKEMELAPVPADDMSDVTDKMSVSKDKMSGATDKMPTLNKAKEEKNNNNGEVVVDNAITEVLKSAAEATGSSVGAFANLGITVENAAMVQDVIGLYRSVIAQKPDTIKTNPVGYLRTMISAAIKGGGMKALVGEVVKPVHKPKAPQSDPKDWIGTGWAEFRDGLHLDKRLDADTVAEFEKDYVSLIGAHPVRDIPELIGIFVSDYWFFNPNGNDLDATALKNSLRDFMRRFSREH